MVAGIPQLMIVKLLHVRSLVSSTAECMMTASLFLCAVAEAVRLHLHGCEVEVGPRHQICLFPSLQQVKDSLRSILFYCLDDKSCKMA